MIVYLEISFTNLVFPFFNGVNIGEKKVFCFVSWD
uniref:Uncharacterized protein n=1 Tax=Arundo donax TaxID=35708 RepID=A0A0A8ZR51_ARUDO